MFLLTILISFQARANCSASESLDGTYVLLGIVKAQMQCRENGTISLPGCLISLERTEDKIQKRYSVFSVDEVCRLKIGGKFDFKFQASCCDVGEDFLCLDANNPNYKKKRSIQQYACNSGTHLYIQQYKDLGKPNSLTREFNKIKNVFETSGLKN